jgi:ABC-type glycerol-3-phosphate transport system permease component
MSPKSSEKSSKSVHKNEPTRKTQKSKTLSKSRDKTENKDQKSNKGKIIAIITSIVAIILIILLLLPLFGVNLLAALPGSSTTNSNGVNSTSTKNTNTVYVNNTTNNCSYYDVDWLNQNFSWGAGIDHIYVFSYDWLFYNAPYNFTNFNYSVVIVARDCGPNTWNDYNVSVNGTLITYTNQSIFLQGHIADITGEIDILIFDQFASVGYWVTLDFYFYLTQIP